ncbi:DUF6477 family protein [Siculibacillus lacustris]|uniref:DUF6477 family protein n=1 Tax=Siculibacillus lacustris TaxID=1549641 RepID=UPI0019D31C09|nr:DUF6477 family protein [Siculibacillus lacustris]
MTATKSETGTAGRSGAATPGWATRIAGREAYRRERMLPRLIAVGPEEIADDTASGRSAVLRRLLRALRGERMRGRAGHWSYSLDRHVGLVQAAAAERRALARQRVRECAAIPGAPAGAASRLGPADRRGDDG